MASDEITCSAVDGIASVVVTRRNANSFPAQLQWKASDNDAQFNTHYTQNEGTLKWKSGESEKMISIPVVNDPSGEERSFNVTLTEVTGRDRIGDSTECKVNISNSPSKQPSLNIATMCNSLWPYILTGFSLDLS